VTRSSTVFSPARPSEPSPAFGYRAIVIGAALVLLLIGVVAIALGPYQLSAKDLFALLMAKATGAASPPAPAETVILQIRLPRLLAATAVGAGLAVDYRLEQISSSGIGQQALPQALCFSQ
jgi:ABC-type Fe3+-siderophore transport system permease subunit